jgi:hypothetical protein
VTYIELGVLLRASLERLLARFSLPLGLGSGPSAESRSGLESGGLESGGGAEGRACDDGGHGACFRERTSVGVVSVGDAGRSALKPPVVRCRISGRQARTAPASLSRLTLARHGDLAAATASALRPFCNLVAKPANLPRRPARRQPQAPFHTLFPLQSLTSPYPSHSPSLRHPFLPRCHVTTCLATPTTRP